MLHHVVTVLACVRAIGLLTYFDSLGAYISYNFPLVVVLLARSGLSMLSKGIAWELITGNELTRYASLLPVLSDVRQRK